MQRTQLSQSGWKTPANHPDVRSVMTCETRCCHGRPLAVVTAWIMLMINFSVYADDSVWIGRSGFDELRQGTATDGGQNLYVSRAGRVQTINRMDLNRDGEIDLLFTQDHDNFAAPDAMIYWGGPEGFQSLLPEMWKLRAPFSVLTWLEQASSKITRLPATGGGRTRVADLNNDGRLDIVIANFTHNYRTDQKALIYWGNETGFSDTNRTELPTFLASGVAVGDLNGDHLPEIVLSNKGDERGEFWGSRLHLESYIYWEIPTGTTQRGGPRFPRSVQQTWPWATGMAMARKIWRSSISTNRSKVHSFISMTGTAAFPSKVAKNCAVTTCC